FGKLFTNIFKTIMSDNGSEFANLAACLKNVNDVYFARPYASYERSSNEKHNGLLRRYVPKGKAISDYSSDAIKSIYQRLNNLPSRIMNYQQPSVEVQQEIAKLV